MIIRTFAPVRLAGLAALLLTTACSDASQLLAPEPATPGTLTVHWITPHAADGAVRLTLEGPGIESIDSAQTDGAAFVRAEGERHSIAVLGTVRTGALLRFEVPDTRQAELYEVTLIEVADTESSGLRDGLDGYEVSVR